MQEGLEGGLRRTLEPQLRVMRDTLTEELALLEEIGTDVYLYYIKKLMKYYHA